MYLTLEAFRNFCVAYNTVRGGHMTWTSKVIQGQRLKEINKWKRITARC